MSGSIASLPRAIVLEFSELTLHGPRSRRALTAALAVGIAILLALILRLQHPYWAGIASFLCVQGSQTHSLRRGLHCMIGSILGASLTVLLFSWVVYNPAVTMLLLFVTGTAAVLGNIASQYSYAWLLSGLTVILITLSSLNNPELLLNLAFFRCAEMVLGAAVAQVTAFLLLPPSKIEATPALGWRRVFDPEHRHVVNHAMRSGLAVCLAPVIWRFFELPDLSTAGLLFGVVMAVPAVTGKPEIDQHAVAGNIAQLSLGALIGGGAGLLFLLSPFALCFPTWLLTVMLAAAIGAELQSGRHGVATAGTFLVITAIFTIVQGWSPPDSILPAIGYITGVFGVIMLMFTISLILGPPLRAERTRT